MEEENQNKCENCGKESEGFICDDCLNEGLGL